MDADFRDHRDREAIVVNERSPLSKGTSRGFRDRRVGEAIVVNGRWFS